MSIIFYLQHIIKYPDLVSRKGIGEYSTLVKARSALERLKDKPGFSDHRGRFSVFPCELGRDYAPEGCDTAEREIKVAPLLNVAQTPLAPDLRLYPLYNKDIRDKAEFDNDFTLIGFYATSDEAQRASDRVSHLFPGPTREFEIGRCWVDRTSWAEGFGPG